MEKDLVAEAEEKVVEGEVENKVEGVAEEGNFPLGLMQHKIGTRSRD